MMEKTEKNQKIEELALRLLRLARDTIVVNLRFMDVALNRLTPVSRPGLSGVACDGRSLFYDSTYLLKRYQEDKGAVVRIYLHALLHCIFAHGFKYGKVEQELWDLSADIAVENIIMEMKIPAAALKDDADRQYRLQNLKKETAALTAEKIYKNFLVNQLASVDMKEYRRLFFQDMHSLWGEKEEYTLSGEQWRKISERIKADIKTFSKDKNSSESLSQNLSEVTKERYDYAELLRRFTVMGEDVTVNDEEFDYIYYTYGLSCYKNMPLVEPLEYKDVKKIKDFAIVIDTSASCKGSLVQSFLKKTYGILKGTENFFHQINVHIIQCDNEVQSDTKITSDADFEAFLKNGKLAGFGGTDFRPAFTYIEALQENGEFENFKGLIYFTDGYGIYPERAPEFDSMFVFLSEDDKKPQVPWWAIRVVLEEEQIEEENSADEH